jgi:hypothetical protein
MAKAQSLLSQLSGELSAAVEGAVRSRRRVRGLSGHRLSGVLWRADAVVVSEQALPDADVYDIAVDGPSVKRASRGRAIRAPMSPC